MVDSDQIDGRLSALLDKQALRELGLTYCRAVDRQDFVLARSLYHDDAVDDHGMFKGSADDYIAWLETVMTPWEVTCHSLTNTLYALDGDHAQGELYFHAYHRSLPPESRVIIIGGRYLDHYERREGVWKFAHRTLVTDWCEIKSVDMAGYETQVAPFRHGRGGATDPSYEVLALFGRGK